MLPARVTLSQGEAIDSYLERLLAANDVLPTEGLRLIRADDPDPQFAFLMVSPIVRILQILSGFTGEPSSSLENATLRRFAGGLPLDFRGFDRRDIASFRAVSARGWFPLHGSQVCPSCIAESGQWNIHWRLPHVVACPKHEVYLVERCVRCQERFRARRNSVLRPDIGPDHLCGNPNGVRNYCRHPVSEHKTVPASADDLAANAAILDTISGAPQYVCGRQAMASSYLTDVRALAVLLAHIATRSTPPRAEHWAHAIREEAARRTSEHRGPRWGIRPPEDPQVRGAALAEAHALLSHGDLGTAAVALAEWIFHIPSTEAGPAGWIRNRMPKSSLVAELVDQALSTRQSTSRRLAATTGEVGLLDSAIPQVIPLEIYQHTLGTVIDAGPDVGRRFASLCLAKLNAPRRTWSRAAEVLGYPPETGNRTPRAVTHKMSATVPELNQLVTSIRDELIGGPDYRNLESTVRSLAADSDPWFPAWAQRQTPPRWRTTLPYAIAWMWTKVAHGDLETSPGWTEPPTRQQKAGYRAFVGRLPVDALSQLKAIASAQSAPTSPFHIAPKSR